jgi:hypothetical protein
MDVAAHLLHRGSRCSSAGNRVVPARCMDPREPIALSMMVLWYIIYVEWLLEWLQLGCSSRPCKCSPRRADGQGTMHR